MTISNMRAASMQLQDRDVTLLRGLFESRVMTTKHVATLYFGGRYEAAKKRLRKIKAAGFIADRKRHVNEPAILFLTRKSFALLREQGVLQEYPSFSMCALENRANVRDRTILHELEVMDVKAAFYTALAKSKMFSIARFSTWPLLNEFTTTRPGHGADFDVKPDGFIRIHELDTDGNSYRHDHFLEVDRSSEQLDTLLNKAVYYREYYRSGGYAVRNGKTRTAIEEFPFRVLFVVKNTERRNNLAERLAHNTPPILTQTWLATRAEVTSNPLGDIWIQPADYREITRGTPFYNEHLPRKFAYRHQPEREAFVESRIKKSRLLAG